MNPKPILRHTRADRARGIPMAMLLGLQTPIAPPGNQPPPRLLATGRAHAKVCNSTLRRAHEILARIGPCEAKAVTKEAGYSKSHTTYTLRALAELGMADVEILPANRRRWRARVDCDAVAA